MLPGGRIFSIFSSGYSDNVLGPFVNRNQYSAWIELLIPVALYLAFKTDRRRWLHGPLPRCMFSSVIASGSRAGIALAVAEVLAALLILAKRRTLPRKASRVAVCQFLALAAVATVVASWQNCRPECTAVAPKHYECDALKASLQMVRVHPWIGWGLGSWPEVYPRYAGLTAAFT